MNDTALSAKLFKSPAGKARIMAAYQKVLDRWPAPYEEIEAETRFGRTHLIASGEPDAPPLILLHAFYATAMVWLKSVEALSQRYRVYAVDCIGEPNPSTPTRPISSRLEFSQWMTDVMDFLKIERADLVGNSNGGFLTLNQALYTPERVRKIVLLSPAATFVQMWPFYFNFFLPVLLGSRPLIHRALRWCSQGLPGDEDWEDLFLACLMEGLSQNRVFPAVFKNEELQRIQAPTLLLIGDHEVIYSPTKSFERATRLVRGLCAETIPDANHIPEISNPAWVTARILKFLQE